jgi:hypothetical protein
MPHRKESDANVTMVTKREGLEAALAQAEAAREYLEAALAEAKAALVNTVTDASKIDANQAEASARVEKARARCRELRAALVKSERSELMTRSRERIATPSAPSEDPSKREVTASALSIESRNNAVRNESKGSQDGPRRRKSIRRFINALAASMLVRQTIGLLSLVSAYLFYCCFDTRLTIAMLPSVFS